MAHGHSVEEMKKEYFDSTDDLKNKFDELVQWIKISQHFIIFTGAGISTSTGIPDFRSGMNTVLKTGPGHWELEDHKAKRMKSADVIDDMQKAMPSITHMALVALQQKGILKCVISQNCDGLHLRSGLNSACLAELHGNMNLETCSSCGAKYLRDFDTVGVRSHYTGRRCDKSDCRGRLKDSIIDFGEDLPEDELNKAFDHANKADLCLVLGSSLTVTPASDVPERVVERKQKLVIGNLQRTPLYETATLNIHTFSDTIMQAIMERLNIPIPVWNVRRRVHVTRQQVSSRRNRCKITIEGRDPDNSDIPYSLFNSIEVIVNQKKIKQLLSQPFVVDLYDSNEKPIILRLHFYGHYNETPYDLIYSDLKNMPNDEQFYLLYNPLKGEWKKTDCSSD